MIKRMTIATDNDGDEDVLVYRPDCSHDISHWVVTLNQKGNDHVDSHYYYNDLYIIGAVCLSVRHVFDYFPVCV